MNRILIILLAIIMLSISICAQDQDENARDIFLGSRRQKNAPSGQPKQENPKTNASPPPRRLRRQGVTSQVRPKRNRPAAAANQEQSSNSSEDIRPTPTLGVGYTIFLKDRDSDFIRVNPDRIFQTGQSIRILVETNVDGYLYVFHQENNGPAKMLFPTWLVQNGNNRIWAHYPRIIPDPNLAELEFTGRPAIEKLTLVVSRRPLEGVPLSDELRGKTYVPVSGSLFEEIARPCNCREYVRNDTGVKMTGEEGARDIELKLSDPAPTRIMLNRDQRESRLVTLIYLTHN